MATLQNGAVNGLGMHLTSSKHEHALLRFADVPPHVDIPLSGGDIEETVEVDLEELLDDPTELCTLLENENAPKNFWVTIALAYAKQKKVDTAVEIVARGLQALTRGSSDDKLGLLNLTCWLYLLKCRDAPRVVADGQLASEARNKEYYIRSAMSTLNEASRIRPSYPLLFLARGVLCLLRASLQMSQVGGSANNERQDTLRQAGKCFDDALRLSGGRNMLALMGRARTQFSLGNFRDALASYQQALERAPALLEPDPRVGIGCCLWQLGYKDDAKAAWDRALELNPSSKTANILLGLYHLHASFQFSTKDPRFGELYRQAMTQYTQKAFKLDERQPLTNATFGSFFLMRKALPRVERLARRAIELTDVSAIASDGWYLLARKSHFEEDLAEAADFYQKADQARGGDERGYLPAKLGSAQLRILDGDYDAAKFKLEKIATQTKSVEVSTLLGSLYAEEVFQSFASAIKEDKSTDMKKAIALLESVRTAWKDSKRSIQPDTSVLLNLARLYEQDQPEKSFQCLKQVEEIELAAIPEDDRPDDVEDPEQLNTLLREFLSPQLLNNMACFYYNSERYDLALDLFQTALNACVKASEADQTIDTDALVTTISFNLARTYEAESMLDQASEIYEGLLKRHADYTDAKTRLAYIALRQDPSEAGPKAVSELYGSDSTDLDVRALYGWYLNKAKKRTQNIAEDQEQRHFKHTLQYYDKHDRYSLTGMGNLYLTVAREMRRESEQDRERRSKMYVRAVEFFDKALQLDPKNAYAAQGLAIAIIEDKRDFTTGIQILSKVRDTMKEASVFVNLGHVFCEVKQYSRAIENYEAALAKNRAHDPQILACLGRVWFLRGRQEKNVQAMKTALDYSRRALEFAPDQTHFRFNVAYVQFQIAQQTIALPEAQRTSTDLENAMEGLNSAIELLDEISKAPNPPFPRGDLEQRANMGRNTMRRQIERALQSQREYEEKNAAKLQQAREQREAEQRRREEEKQAAENAREEQRRKIAEERQRIAERDRQLAEKRTEMERLREEAELTMDEETGERVKRKKKPGKRRKREEDDIINDDDVDGDEGGERPYRSGSEGGEGGATSDRGKPRKPKKRRLERKSQSKNSSKFKSSEFIEESDEEALPADDEEGDVAADSLKRGESDDEEVTVSRRKRQTRVVDDDDADDDEEAKPRRRVSRMDVDSDED